MKYIQNWDAIKEHYQAFWEGAAKRPILSILAPKDGHRYIREGMGASVTPNVEDAQAQLAYWTDGEAVYARTLERLNNTYFAADALPVLNFNLGACSHAGFFRGAKFRYHDSLWFQPSMEEITDPIEFDENSFMYQKMLELARFFAERSQGDMIVSLPDNGSYIDALAHLRGSDNLLVDMLESPEDVAAGMAKIAPAWKKCLHAMHQALKDNNDGGSSIGWLRTWAPKLHFQMQADISVMISPRLYEQLVLPELVDQCNEMDYPLYHLDGQEQVRHLDLLLGLKKLACIQWTCVAGQPSPLEFIDTLRKIQEAGKNLMIIVQPSEVRPLLEQLNPGKLMLAVDAANPAQADELAALGR